VWRVEIEVGVATPILSLAPGHDGLRRAAAGFQACAAESDFESITTQEISPHAIATKRQTVSHNEVTGERRRRNHFQ
jgi:hypothetical protein